MSASGWWLTFAWRFTAHLQRLSLSFYADRRTGEIVSRLTNDVTLLQEAVTNNRRGPAAADHHVDWRGRAAFRASTGS